MTKSTIYAAALFTSLFCVSEIHAALVTFDLTNGSGKAQGNTTAGSFPGDNTTFPTGSGSTIADDTQGTGLTVTITPGGGYRQVGDLGLADTNVSNVWRANDGDTFDLVFNQDVLLQTLFFSSGVNSRFIGGQPILDPAGTNVTLSAQQVQVSGRQLFGIDWSSDPNNAVLTAGETLRLTYPTIGSTAQGDSIGFFGGITVDTVQSAETVPEPNSLVIGIIGTCLLGLLAWWRRK